MNMVKSESNENKSTVTVRRGTYHDIPEVSKMWAQIVIGEDKTATPSEVIYCDQAYKLMTIDQYYLFVAEIGGEIVGFNDGIVAVDPADGQTYIAGRHFYVKPIHRNGTVGKLLHKNSVDAARRVGAKLIRRNIRIDKAENMLSKGHTLREYVIDEYIKEA